MTKDNERAEMIEILRYILVKDLGKEKAKKYIEMLEGGINMGTFVNELRLDRERTIANAKAEGIDIGKEDIIFKAVKKMVKNKVKKDTDIMKYMHISKEELEKLKMQIV